MAFFVSRPGRDGVATVYMAIKPGPVDAAKLVAEIETATGRKLTAGGVGHLVTGSISYSSQTIVQIRIHDGEVELTQAEGDAAEAAILAHVP